MTKRFNDYLRGYACPVDAAFDVLGGKWKGVILYHLLTHDVLRFNALQRLVPAATHKTLTRQLRELEDDGVITRRVYSEVPPKVEYSLTTFGRTLEPIILLMCDWGEKFIERVSARDEAMRETAAS